MWVIEADLLRNARTIAQRIVRGLTIGEAPQCNQSTNLGQCESNETQHAGHGLCLQESTFWTLKLFSNLRRTSINPSNSSEARCFGAEATAVASGAGASVVARSQNTSRQIDVDGTFRVP